MVYKLYELTYEEVKVVDENIGKVISEENYKIFNYGNPNKLKE
jgi:hypothetical protein